MAMKKEAKMAYEEMSKVLKAVGPLNFNQWKYSREQDIAHSTINRWYKKWLLENPWDQKGLAQTTRLQGESILNRLARIALDKDNNLSLKGSIAYLNAAEKYVELMERLGVKKEDIPEQHIHVSTKDESLMEILTAEQKKKLVKMMRSK